MDFGGTRKLVKPSFETLLFAANHDRREMYPHPSSTRVPQLGASLDATDQEANGSSAACRLVMRQIWIGVDVG